MVKEFTFFKQKYSVHGLGWQVQGDFWAHEYEITQNDQIIVSISKEWMTWGDSYEIRMADDVDEIMALSVVLVIDACMASQNNSNAAN